MKATNSENIKDFVGEIEKDLDTNSIAIGKNKELDWIHYSTLITKTNHHGEIEYANEAFLKATGYEAHELISKPHSLIRHPDVPKAIYEYMKQSLINTGHFSCFIKIKTKNDNYFWTEEHCTLKEENEEPLIHMKRYFVKDEIIRKEVAPLYNNLRELENDYNIEMSLNYLKNYLNTFSVSTCGEWVESIKEKYKRIM